MGASFRRPLKRAAQSGMAWPFNEPTTISRQSMRSTPGFVLLLLSATATTACESPTEQTSSVVRSPMLERSASAPVHMLTGGGKTDLLAFELPPETYAFSAMVDADGNVRGEAEMKLSDPLVNLHAQITCLVVEGNSAWVGGVVTRTSDPVSVPEGRQFWTQVLDNGAGNASDPDRIGFIRLGAPASRCNLKRTFGVPFAFAEGNLTVR